MKTFAVALAFAAVASARGHRTVPSPPEPPMEGEEDPMQAESEYWEDVENRAYYARNLWLGVVQGLYGMGGLSEKPTEDCFGSWIPQKMRELDDFSADLATDFRAVTVDDCADAAYNVVDLAFLNDEYCHFRSTFWDLYDYCHEEENPCGMGKVLENMQVNAFNVITQASQAASIFKQQEWDEMDRESRAYALNQVGHAGASVVSDLIGFNNPSHRF